LVFFTVLPKEKDISC